MKGEVKDVVTVVESMRGGRRSDEASCLEPEVRGASEIGDLREGAEKVRGTGVF